MIDNKWIFIFLIVVTLVFKSFNANAEIKIIAPQKVAKGDAFLAEVWTNLPTEFFTFVWNGKNIKIPAENIPDSKITKNYHAKVLLPVPLEEKDAKKTLSVSLGNSVTANKNMDKVQIELIDKKRPFQKLAVDRKYVSPPPEALAQINEDRKKINTALSQHLSGRFWQLPFARPLQGNVSSQFGLKRIFNGQPRGDHKGLDLRGAEGTPIKAAADGKAVLVDNLYYSGKTIYINHGDGVVTAYFHLSKPLVHAGENIARGQTIGLVGSTGRATGPHLHLSTFVQGVPVDPLPLLETVSTHKLSTPGNNK